jgi:hypothetical protein
MSKEQITLLMAVMMLLAVVAIIFAISRKDNDSTEKTMIAANLFENQYKGGIGGALGNLDINKALGLLGI